MSRFWFFPVGFLVVYSLQHLGNIVSSAKDKAVVAYNVYGNDGFIVFILVISLLMEIGYGFMELRMKEGY